MTVWGIKSTSNFLQLTVGGKNLCQIYTNKLYNRLHVNFTFGFRLECIDKFLN